MNFYTIDISVDLGNTLPPVGEFLKELNTDLSRAGMSEQLIVRGKLFSVTLTSQRELTNGDKTKVKEALLEAFNEQQPAWKIKVESFRRKSGNVQQSVS